MNRLSNTATPKYYAIFRQKVLDGEIPVCEQITLQMNRIDRRIDNPKYYYDPGPVESWIAFCEKEMTLTDGSKVNLLLSFKLWAEDILGWYYFVTRQVYVLDPDGYNGHYETRQIKVRLTNKQYLIVGRGAAKSLYDAFFHAYFLVVDGTTTEQIATSPTMAQTEETIQPIRTAITRSVGPLFKLLTMGSLQNTTGNRDLRQKLCSTKLGIQNFLSNSIIMVKPMTIDKLQGYRPKLSTVDEWLSGDTKEDVVGSLEQGAAKVDDWLIIATSSEGTVRNGPGDDIKMELMSILRNEYKDEHTSIWWYKLDDISEIGDVSVWAKANPNLGFTVSYETYQTEVLRAENNPSQRNDTLAKRFGLPMEGYTYFFTYDETLPHRHREYWKMPCAMGADLSQGDDFCAFTFMFPLSNGCFGVKTRSYITSLTLMRLPPAMRNKYDEFIREGTLHIMDGTVLQMIGGNYELSESVYDDLDKFITENEYDVRCFGYDPYNAKEFVEKWCSENGEYGVTKVIQGAKTESVPLGELKKLASEKMLLFDEELMTFAMGNAIVLEDTNGNRKLYKRRQSEKIDNVAAMMDAFVAYKLFKEEFE